MRRDIGVKMRRGGGVENGEEGMEIERIRSGGRSKVLGVGE
jgi:hypothetical protein